VSGRQGTQASDYLLGCKPSEAIFQDRKRPFTCGNVELRGFEPLTSCMPCKSGNQPARALASFTCGISALVCLWVPASLYGMAVHLAVRCSFDQTNATVVACQLDACPGSATGTTSRPSIPSKSSALQVYTGRRLARAVAAISAS
jgi:hypothetical protein